MTKQPQEEKKVEYIELIYDLIFVYLIGRNNELLHNISGGFVDTDSFLAYILCSVAIIQIWSYSSVYINLHGRNGARDHIFLFINMYLLYYMGKGINTDWSEYFYQFNIAWALILVNIALQHFIETKNNKDVPGAVILLKEEGFVILAEVVLILIHILVYYKTGISIAYVPILFGIVAAFLSGNVFTMFPVDFMHLTERAMLYVVFTFGEMIISISAYFEGGFTLSALYFSLMAFLIVVTLFMGYEVLYNKIVDRELMNNGLVYLLIHVFLILSLNNISASLEFMREDEVALLPKILFITISFLIYFTCLFLLGIYAKKKHQFRLKFVIKLIIWAAIFVVLMIAFQENMYINIAISVLFTGGMFYLIHMQGRYNSI